MYSLHFYGPFIVNDTLYGSTDALPDNPFLNVHYGQNTTLTVPIYNQNLEAVISFDNADDNVMPIFIGNGSLRMYDYGNLIDAYRLTITGDCRIEASSSLENPK